MARGWKDLLRSLGDSLLEVAGAEAAALKGDLRSSGQQLSVAVAVGVSAAFFLFWWVGASGFVLFQVLAIWLPRWGAALIVATLFLVLALALALEARRRFRAIELPVDTVRRRIDDHVAWWQDQVLMEDVEREQIESSENP